MSQFWTTSKPDRTGQWWAKNKHGQVEILKVVLIEVDSFSDPELCADTFDKEDISSLNDKYFKDTEWGSSPIPEPASRKY